MADSKAPGPAKQAKPRDRKHDIRMIAIGVVAVLLIWFGLTNLHRTKVQFWLFEGHVSVIVVIIISCFLGLVAGLLIGRRRTTKPPSPPK